MAIRKPACTTVGEIGHYISGVLLVPVLQSEAAAAWRNDSVVMQRNRLCFTIAVSGEPIGTTKKSGHRRDIYWIFLW